LLHGFGFAGALKEIGLPQIDVPLALLTFTLGVEAGQLLFVGMVLLIFKSKSTLMTMPMSKARIAAAYLIGTASTFWFMERLASFAAS